MSDKQQPDLLHSHHSATGIQAEQQLLAGPQERRREFWLLLGTLRDFLKGFRVLHFVGPCVTIFGSARFNEGHPYYELTRRAAERVSRLGFTVMTGGGPGLMEAANRGAREAGGPSVGCNIILPHEQFTNAYLDQHVTCEYFFVRKVLLFKYSYAFVAMPGGIGTLDELFEALTLVQTRKIDPFPIVLIGKEYWEPMRGFLKQMTDQGAIDAADQKLVLYTDDLDEMAEHLQRNAVERFGLTERRKPRAFRWLGEYLAKV